MNVFKKDANTSAVTSAHTCTSSLLQVGPHAVIVRKHGGCCPDFCSHVANSGHSCTHRQAVVKQVIPILLFLGVRYRKLYCMNTFKLISFWLLTRAGNGVDSWSMVLYDGSSASLYSQDAGHLQDDILRRRPAGQGACQLHANHLRGRQNVNEMTKKEEKKEQDELCNPLTLGHLSSQGIPAMTSTASAPPTPMQMLPSPPPFGVWESVPISITPG